MKKNVCLLVAGLSATMLASSAMAQDETFKLDEVTCFDVISQAEDDALFLTALLIGHASGASGNTEMSGSMLKATVEAMDTVCGENPDMLAIDALKAS